MNVVAGGALPGRRSKHDAGQQPARFMSSPCRSDSRQSRRPTQIVKLRLSRGALLSAPDPLTDLPDRKPAHARSVPVTGVDPTRERLSSGRAPCDSSASGGAAATRSTPLLQFLQQTPCRHILQLAAPFRQSHSAANASDNRRRLHVGFAARNCRIRSISAVSSLALARTTFPSSRDCDETLYRSTAKHCIAATAGTSAAAMALPARASNCCCSGRRLQLAPSLRPAATFSSRFAQTHSPDPSKYKILSRFLSRFVKTKRWPVSGSWPNTVCT